MTTSHAHLVRLTLILFSAVRGVTSPAAETVPYGVGSWPEKFGNHRAVVQVAEQASAVFVRVPWRRRDSHPERKAVWVFAARTGKPVRNVCLESITREAGELVFEPTSGPGSYYIYYMPYVTEGSPYFPSVRYLPPKTTADPTWVARFQTSVQGRAEPKAGPLPRAQVVQIQAINDFHRFDPMEVIATAVELQSLLKQHDRRNYLVFPEDRRYPIRMTSEIPLRWIEAGPRDRFRAEALRGEFYVFQLGLFASRQRLEDVRAQLGDLRGGGRTIPASALRCFNLGGTDWLGRPFQKKLAVEKGKVQALWFGLQVPMDAAATTYRGTISIRPANAPASDITLELAVSDRRIEAAGDGDLRRQARLRWLDSTIGLDDQVVEPYTPVQVDGRTVKVLGRQLRFADTGLPASIQSRFNASIDAVDAPPREILAGPVRLVVEDAEGPKQWSVGKPRITMQAPGAVTWESASTARGLRMSCKAKMECDGYVNYHIQLAASRPADIKNICLEIPIRKDVAKYMMGMGRKGGKRPEKWDWQWNLDRANPYAWVGDVNVGLHFKLKHVTPDWSLYNLRDTGLYRDWSNGGKGGCSFRQEGQAVVVRAFTGPRSVAKGETLHFNIGMLVTPVKMLDKRRWQWRYFHRNRARPVNEVAKTGATIINLHQGDALNPHINYPFRTTDQLRDYVRQANANGMKVKIYYTVRELSNYAAEFWALRSLGDEIFTRGKGFALADQFDEDHQRQSHPRTGSSWLCEHVITGYVPAWHQHLGNGKYDAAIAQTGLSRWHNYYLEGLNWLVRRVGIEGLYLDGIGYDREIMKRVRKVMLRARPSCLIDFHSGNNFSPNYGLNNCAGQYMELFPYIDSLWFGEGFDYNQRPDYWLVEISGIPFGLFGEMLQGGGNPWRGMVYGMTNRLGWGGDPREIWKVWDQFGIQNTKMLGYWEPACPVRTTHQDILATVYQKKGKALVAMASWAKAPVECRLQVDWKSLGLNPEKTRLYAPAIPGFQAPAIYRPSDPIAVMPGRGWLLIVDEQTH